MPKGDQKGIDVVKPLVNHPQMVGFLLGLPHYIYNSNDSNAV